MIAPSSPFEAKPFVAGLERLRRRYEVRVEPDVLRVEGYLAGTDARRLEELLDALDDPEVEMLIAARGGYGATRLLAGLEPARIERAAKLLVGFSDITALHAAWGRAGLRSLHGPMVTTLGRVDEETLAHFFEALEGALPQAIEALEPICPGRARGPLLGGNLSVLLALLGTPYEPPLAGSVLLLEDVGERPYRVDRMLTTLRASGRLRDVRGIALGSFTDCRPGVDAVGVQAVLRERLGDLPIPIVMGIPVGHGEVNRPLPLGAEVELDADAGTLRWLEGLFG
ncbi:MAG: LD-carboxypeptidase [Myxococcales bacterium]|nr:LD-carboxypeptidase [Myxococcales bacterium]